jgi:hypothetical protein
MAKPTAADATNKITLETIRYDAHCVSKTHSWYKLPWPHAKFYIWFEVKESKPTKECPSKEPRLHMCMDNFWERHFQDGWSPAQIEAAEKKQNFVLITPLFRGNDGTPEKPSVRNTPRIGNERDDGPTYTAFLAQHGITGERWPKDVPLGESELIRKEGLLYESERLRMIEEIVAKATVIAREKGLLLE